MRPWLAVCTGILAVGCVHTNVQRLDQAARPATLPDSVTVLRERPQQPHTVIATIASNGWTVFDSFADLREAMITEAATLGGDALILGPECTPWAFIFTGTALIKSDRKRLTGEVIVYNSQ
jgi:hypothetical protein